ncbi:hypothetical protein LY90DRAFT_672795 [Neocallimastix californiae]|uniref:Vacuolar fusion protein MON1 n=1 Tax=Neocallimastix californiae TaxID=1754190 RepID=A0A1Y2BRY9_9FUNG|nr:hypothetical protein LY90DRAFT_672795 [Neocallimastix californiae]|eukprot:ORY37531.1 hypothetical protein LY90DRAFT_672795 [Neocallimastix californiae]
MENFYVINKAGKILLSKNITGKKLDENLLLGFSSSTSNFCQSLFSEGIREIITSESKILFREVENYIFVLHSSLNIGSHVLKTIIKDIVGLCEFIFGKPSEWNDSFTDFKGIQDILCNQMFELNPTTIVKGIKKVSIEDNVQDRIDKLLAVFENQDGICSNSTLILLGESILYSRFSLHESRMILHYYKSRPLGSQVMRYVPVYTQDSWNNLYFVKMQNFVFVFKTFIDKTYNLFKYRVEEFRISLIQSRLDIPIEEPPVLLRMFAKRDVFALLYVNIKTGNTIFPQIRPGPEIQQKEIINIFWDFYYQTCSLIKIPGVNEISINKDQYRFYAKTENVHRIFILFSSEFIKPENIISTTNEILRNIKFYN